MGPRFLQPIRVKAASVKGKEVSRGGRVLPRGRKGGRVECWD